jgi:hypothetical protein
VLICVPRVLSKDDVADFRRIMDDTAWEDGRSTAGAQSAMVKRNEQLPPDSEVARMLGHRVLSALTAIHGSSRRRSPSRSFRRFLIATRPPAGTISASMSTTR